MGAEIYQTERGGDITFHGPGQAVLYSILSLRDLKLGVRKYVEGLEDTMIRLCHLYGITAKGRMVKETGVWVSDNRKIGAVGVRVSSSSITSHGLAFNMAPDLRFFQHIVPCGIADKRSRLSARNSVPPIRCKSKRWYQSSLPIALYNNSALKLSTALSLWRLQHNPGDDDDEKWSIGTRVTLL
jgi:lipoyl(octanoyl) transferase